MSAPLVTTDHIDKELVRDSGAPPSLVNRYQLLKPDAVIREELERILRLDLWRLSELLSQPHQLIEAGYLSHGHQLRVSKRQSRGLTQPQERLIVELA